MRITPTEAQTQAAIMDLLAAKRIYAGRLNTGAGFVGGRPVQHHTFGRGCADILAFAPTSIWSEADDGMVSFVVPLWIEVKTASGKQSAEQKSFQEHVTMLGHRYLLARSIEQVAQFLKEFD